MGIFNLKKEVIERNIKSSHKAFETKNEEGQVIGMAFTYPNKEYNAYKLEKYYEVYFYGDIDEKLLNELIEAYSDDILIYKYFYYNVDLDLLKKCGFKKQVGYIDGKDVEEFYNLYSNKDNTFILNNYLKNIHYEESIDVNKVVYEKVSENEFIDLIYDSDCMEYNYLHYLDSPNSFIGFRYFSINDNDKHINDSYYILAKYEDNIVGVISVKEYEILDRLEYFVSFIDVRKDLKHKGIATGMIKYLSEINENDIISTDLSDEGEKVEINKVFERYLKDKWFNAREDYNIKRSL